MRTGDKSYYYVIDKRRRLCFFHAKMYGKKHLQSIDCEKLPEFKQYAQAAPKAHRPPTRTPHDAPHTHDGPAHRRDTRTAPPRTDPAPTRPGATSLTNRDREAFRRAYVQYFCSRRAGTEEPLEVILSRHRLDMERWNLAKQEFSADRDMWEALTSEATEACP